MWRTRAVLSMLLEDVGGLRSADEESLDKERRRCRWVIGIDWLAIILLVASHDHAAAQLAFGGTPQMVFTLGILAVAVHSGFRLGQLEKLNAVARLKAELERRTEP